MSKKAKILVVLLIVLAVVAALFFARSYLFDRLGITADIVTTEKLVASKTVAQGGFSDASLVGVAVVGNAIRLQDPGTQTVCGAAPEGDEDLLPSKGYATVNLSKAVSQNPSEDPIEDKIFVGADGTPYNQGQQIKLNETDASINNTSPGLRVQRGNGWVFVQLGKGVGNKEVSGTITFADGITLRNNSIVNKSAEKISDGLFEEGGLNDEVTVRPNNNTVTFRIQTNENDADGFYINYCFADTYLATGYVQGTIDLGKGTNLTRFVVNSVDVTGTKTKMGVSVALSKDGVTWTDNYVAKNATSVTMNDTAYADTFCFRYIRYRINMRTTDPNTLPGFTGVQVYGGGVCRTQLAASDVQCQDGKDNDGDGKTDYPDDTGCFSPMDDSEAKPEIICQDGTHENISMKINLAEITNEGEGDIKNRVYVDSVPNFYKSGQTIPLVEDGVAIKDTAYDRVVPGVAVQRGNGWVQISMYGRHRPAGTGKETVAGKVTFSGAGVTKVINGTNIMMPTGDWDGPFETQGDGKYTLGDANQDEFYVGESVPESLPNLVEFYSTVTTDIDSFYIYYDYKSKVGGGCQCQDKKDNDGDALIDYPNDPGCTAPIDNDESDTATTDQIIPQCADGIDNDADGLIDFPDDPGCYSSKDNKEINPIRICQDGSHENMRVRVNFNSVENQGNGNMQQNVVVGEEGTVAGGQWIDIVRDGVAVIDQSSNDEAAGVEMRRGNGWVFIRFNGRHPFNQGEEITTGTVDFENTDITGWLNGKGTFNPGDEEALGPFDKQGNGVYVLGTPGEDEFFIPIGGRTATFYTTTSTGADSMYIYYDYVPKVGGGCQCQDGIDNDGDGLIDYPNDPACSSETDNDESENIGEMSPGQIASAAIKSGASFWIIILIVLAIGGFVIYRIAKSKDEQQITPRP